MTATATIEKDLDGDYQDFRGYACVAWKDRTQEGHFEQAFFLWPKKKADAIALIERKVNEGCCVWKPTALMRKASRAEAQFSNVLSFEVDQALTTEAKELLIRKLDATFIKSGRPKHYHVKVYLKDADLAHDENAYYTKWLASAVGITGHADSGGKFQPNDLLRIVGTRNTKPEVEADVDYARTTKRGITFKRLKAILSDFPVPTEDTLALDAIEREEMPEDQVPPAVQSRLHESPSEDRSEQTYAFIQLCREEGLTPGQALGLAYAHEPTYERNEGNARRIEQDVLRCWRKGGVTKQEVEDAIFSTPLLQFLYKEAKARRIAPTAALGTALIHAGLAVPPWFLLPPLIGGDGAPVNLIVANIAPSGSGKGASGSPILEIPPTYKIQGQGDDDVWAQPIVDAISPQAPSSGPAFAALFMELQRKELEEGEKRGRGRPALEELVQYAYARHVHWGEIDTLNTYLENRQDTVSPELREGWSGGKLGSYTKGRENRISVPKNAYRLMVSFDAQPARCGTLMSQNAGGLLQRVIFLSAQDRKRQGRNEGEPQRKRVTLPRTWRAEGFEVVAGVRKAVLEDADSGRYEGTEDSHRNLNRLKVAALLAVLHGGTTVTQAWWDIAGAIMDHSDQVKRDIRKDLKEEVVQRQRSLGTQEFVRTLARDNAKVKLLERTKDRIVKLLHDFGPMSCGAFRSKLSKHQQGLLSEALKQLEAEGVLKVSGVAVTLQP